MKQGKVYIKDVFCGIITESEEGYIFECEKAYLASDDARDRMSLLLACCKDCIGDIGVIELKEDE